MRVPGVSLRAALSGYDVALTDSSLPSAPQLDPLRLATAAYLTRITGSSRDHASSDLRSSCPGARGAAWSRWRRADRI
jgi:hypothetical protein